MYICLFIFTHTSIYMYMYIYIYVYMYICIYTYVIMQKKIFMYIHRRWWGKLVIEKTLKITKRDMWGIWSSELALRGIKIPYLIDCHFFQIFLFKKNAATPLYRPKTKTSFFMWKTDTMNWTYIDVNEPLPSAWPRPRTKVNFEGQAPLWRLKPKCKGQLRKFFEKGQRLGDQFCKLTAQTKCPPPLPWGVRKRPG